MEYCIVCLNYKNRHKQVHTFVDNLVRQLCDAGGVCNIIAPQSLFSFLFKKNSRRKFKEEYTTSLGKKYCVYSPLFFVFPNIKTKFFSFADLSRRMFFRALDRIYKKERLNPDVVYSHFFLAGVSGTMLAKKYGKTSIVANGEADTLDSLKFLSPKMVGKVLEDVDGIICVSSKNREEVSILSGGNEVIMGKTVIIPNAIDETRFFPKNQIECRRKLGLPEKAFIVSFTGSFIERKGVLKLSKAIDMIGDISSIFIGAGPVKPSCRGVLFEGKVDNSKVADYLSASDVFCLPSLAEGCSNAIVEALGCGIPVISSDRAFNYDILDSSCSILVDPEDEREIALALARIKNDPALKERLIEGSVTKSKELSLVVRAQRIEDFIKKIIRAKTV